MDKKIPKHLSKPMQEFYKTVCAGYDLEDHHHHLLRLACEHFDRGQEARLGIDDTGLMLKDRFGQWRSNPLLQVQRDSTLAFQKLIKQLGLNADDADTINMPQIQRSKGLKIG